MMSEEKLFTDDTFAMKKVALIAHARKVFDIYPKKGMVLEDAWHGFAEGYARGAMDAAAGNKGVKWLAKSAYEDLMDGIRLALTDDREL